MQNQKRNTLAECTRRRAFDRKATNVHSSEQAIQCSRDACLRKKVSYFQSATVNTPSGDIYVKAFLLDCKQGKYRKQVEAIRAETDEAKQKAMKLQLPAVTLLAILGSKRVDTRMTSILTLVSNRNRQETPLAFRRVFVKIMT